ncbi:MAG: hypothetical protein K9J37_14715 [Saprospiraceae bacterium]|nr:hypothetical protein [Saprospiraceae bacterium]MCF8251160.1 hypothetical protein [Saprospiraceae bacterium]MCF8281883.1 hypothetical protein [Bacteroidales bacterium]MCF8312972.1 hypothetical protein [Saprospiraceae bacterium]MCF8441419.1 hypothetical protein [Saprospiraceae bacterium]
MASYLSVISAVIRPEIKEKVSIGLLLIGDDKLYLGFSKNKLEVVSQLLPTDVFRGLRFNVKNFQQVAVENEGNRTLFTNHLTVVENLNATIFSESYLGYLSNYKNNIISVSAPNSISIAPTQEVFERLFKKLVDEQGVYIAKKIAQRSFSKIRESAILKERFNYDVEVTQQLFPNLIVPVKIDLVGENEIPTFVKLVDLERRKNYIANDVTSFNFVRDAIPDSKRFIVSREPLKAIFPQQHQIWNNLRSTKWFEYIDITEVERLEEYAQIHQVHKLVEPDED